MATAPTVQPPSLSSYTPYLADTARQIARPIWTPYQSLAATPGGSPLVVGQVTITIGGNTIFL